MRTQSAVATAIKIMAITAQVYGDQAAAGKVFNITPSIAQTIEAKIQQQNAFLQLINIQGVNEVKGEVLGFGVPSSMTKRTTTSNADFKKRRPTDPTGLVKREYECNDYESDALITWDKIDMWAHLPNFYELYREQILISRATDRLRVGWNGQFKAADTDPVTYPVLQDVQGGWLQYLIDNAPEQVLGISPDGGDPLGYTIDPINVGAGGDFESLDQLVYHLRQSLIDRLYRKNTNIRAIAGDELMLKENSGLFGAGVAPTEKLATNLYLDSQLLGRTPIVQSDEFPDRGLFITDPKNLSYYYQKSSLRRKIEEAHQDKGIIDYSFGRDDYPIEAVEGCAAVHPDAIYLKNDADAWAPAAEVWKAVL